MEGKDMRMRRLLAWLLVLVMCFMLTACGKKPQEETPAQTDNTQQTTNQGTEQVGNATPLLYRVTDNDGNVIWLFGSIHVGREDYYPLPAYVQEAFEDAASLAVEADIVAFEKDLGLQIKALTPLAYMDGSRIKDHIPLETYEKAVDIFTEYGSYVSVLDMYCPAMWSSMIDSLLIGEWGGDVNLGLDKYLIEKAYETEKEILEIESVQFQYQMLADFSDDIQLMMLEGSIASYENKEDSVADLKEMMDLWALGDENAFAAYLNAPAEDLTEEETAIYEEYTKIMLTDRNLHMADYAEQALLGGKSTFICVGAAHIVGEGALVQLLAQRGYTVECVTQ